MLYFIRAFVRLFNISLMTLLLAKLLIRLLLLLSIVAYSFNTLRSPSFSALKPSGLINSPRPTFQLHGIAERMTDLIGLLSGQSTITDKNIEDTLKEVKNILVDADVNLQVSNIFSYPSDFSHYSCF